MTGDPWVPGPATHRSTDALHVLVNLTWLVPGVVGGSEESTTDALRAVVEHDDGVRFTLAVHPGFPVAHPDLVDTCTAAVLPGPDPARFGTTAGKVARVVAEQTWLPRLARRVAPDVVHHAGGVLPLIHPGATVLTIHDLQPLDVPRNFSAAKRWYLRAMLGRSAKAADVVCVPSAFTAARVEALLGRARDRIDVVPWSVPRFSGGDPSTRRRPDEPVEPLFVYPAVTHPHKNHMVLLDAFARVLVSIPDARLVLPGGAGSAEPVVARRIRHPDLAGRVERPGRLGTTRIDELYRSAAAVVMPSTYEGFGLPALEAMAAGAPLLVADAGSLPEVVARGDSTAATALPPLDPADPRAWADAMVGVAGFDAATRSAVVTRQRAVASRYDPRATAAALAGAYRRAAASHISSGR